MIFYLVIFLHINRRNGIKCSQNECEKDDKRVCAEGLPIIDAKKDTADQQIIHSVCIGRSNLMKHLQLSSIAHWWIL